MRSLLVKLFSRAKLATLQTGISLLHSSMFPTKDSTGPIGNIVNFKEIRGVSSLVRQG